MGGQLVCLSKRNPGTLGAYSLEQLAPEELQQVCTT